MAAFGAVSVEVEVPIARGAARVWRGLVEETTVWWPREFYAGAEATGFKIEATLGGRVYEDWGGGAGLVWYTVIGLEPGRMVLLAGHLTPAFGGPATTLLRVELAGEAERTMVRVSDSVWGAIKDGSGESIRAGWRTVFEQLRAHVEGDGVGPV